MQVWGYAIVSVLIVSVVSLVGIVALLLHRQWFDTLPLVLVSFSAGTLFGDALIHLLPEAFQTLGMGLAASLWVMLGILGFFVLEQFIRWRHCHLPPTEAHPHPMVATNLFGDGVHNFIDGLVIGASYLVSIPIGIATTMAIVFHEIPQELGDFGVLLHGGMSVSQALLCNFLTALTAIAGMILSLTVGTHVLHYADIMVPIAAGGFLYIAGTDLIPALHQEVGRSNAFLQLTAMILGFGVMVLLKIWSR